MRWETAKLLRPPKIHGSVPLNLQNQSIFNRKKISRNLNGLNVSSWQDFEIPYFDDLNLFIAVEGERLAKMMEDPLQDDLLADEVSMCFFFSRGFSF